MHLLSWEKICAPKSKGSLGLRKAMEINHVLLMKLGWNLISKPNALWVRVLLNKYNKKSYP
ncbi:conserved hypothetical protein [Ricinus communis]|uniref:Uncharacterized protein n=1 Tax=Ricinus communis TaxID=3988 RepID=B9RLY6_RICCO|nr:conserved hypothetical protein [Ricinus communis]